MSVYPGALPFADDEDALFHLPHAGGYSSTASLHPELPRSLPSHASLIVYVPTRLSFHIDGWAEGPCGTLPKLDKGRVADDSLRTSSFKNSRQR